MQFLEDGIGVEMGRLLLGDLARLTFDARQYNERIVQESFSAVSVSTTGYKVAYPVKQNEIVRLLGLYVTRDGSSAEVNAVGVLPKHGANVMQVHSFTAAASEHVMPS